jgi:HemY protein
MRSAVWFVFLFALAAAAALFATHNAGTVSVFWQPYRVDISLNLFLLGLLAAFLLLHWLLSSLAFVLRIPQQAKRWRLQRQERALLQHWLEAFSHLMGGRFVRARKAAELVLAIEASVARSTENLPYRARLRALAHLLAAESAHALQDRSVREDHLRQALVQSEAYQAQEIREGLLLRATRWALDNKDTAEAALYLDQLPQGVLRRTATLRLRFKRARMAGEPLEALEVLRLLTKHRAFSQGIGQSLAQGLAMEYLSQCYDPAQLQRAWNALDASERAMPDVAIRAGERALALGAEVALSRQWVLPIWEAMVLQPDSLGTGQRIRLVRLLEKSFMTPAHADQPPHEQDSAWLVRIEQAQRNNPRDAELQYLAGMMCKHLGLWGKAQVLLRQSQSLLQDASLKRDAWYALAQLAEERQDPAAAALAYAQALKEARRV